MSMTTKSRDEIHAKVSEAYGEAIAKSQSCCSSPGCCTPTSEINGLAIGYSPADLTTVPNQAATSSFGCGNPLAFAEVKDGEHVVDLGSGAGLDLLLAAHKVGPTGKVLGVDMTDEMIDAARANVERAGVDNVEVRKGLIEEMPVEDGWADWVISNCVINLSPEKAKVFAEIARILKPGGTMQVSDVVAEDLPQWIRDRSDLFTACVAGAISEAEYLEGLRAAGLVDVEVQSRMVYEATQISAFLDSDEIPASGADGAPMSLKQIREISEALSGKVWSAKIKARKP